MMRRLALASVTLLILSQAAASQVTEMRVQILNSPPKAYDARSYSVVKSGGMDVAWCKATVEDLNSFRDIVSLRGYLEGGGRVDALLTGSDERSITAGVIYAGFALDRDARAGEWRCAVGGKDNAGDLAEGNSTLDVYPVLCGNRVKDAYEEDADCGGPCMPCSCRNKVLDAGEEGLDCGGPCGYCEGGNLRLEVPPEAYVGEPAEVLVHYSGVGVKSIIVASGRPGYAKAYATGSSGEANVTFPEAGRYRLRAELLGFQPAEAEVEVKTPLKHYIIPVAVALAVLIAGAAAVLKARARKRP